MDRDYNIGVLEPQAVWRHFAQIAQIPHPSYHEERIRDYFVQFAARLELECIVDQAGNVIIRKGATNGMESRKAIILQAHMDMVPQKNNDTQFDFTKDAIKAYIDGAWVRAEGTTLGADNGLGVAAALAVLESDDIAHPDLEVLFTANEESGMDGAEGLSPELLKGEILLNLDTEDEGELCIGCAGGLNLLATFTYDALPAPANGYLARRLTLKGLVGGHSGCQIHEQRGNANKLLFRLLRNTKLDILLCSAQGGSLSNAIPREAYADLLIAQEDIEDFEQQVERYLTTIKGEYGYVEHSISLTLSEIDYPAQIIDTDAAACVIWSIAGCADGVQRFSYEMPTLVQTSSNLAIVKCSATRSTVELFLRSSSESEKQALADSLASVFELADGDVTCEGSHPGWLPNVDSPILATMREGYKALFGSEATVNAVHAGLECGLIGAKYPQMDMISFGPTVVSPHSPDERVDIESVERFYRYLCYTLTNAPQK